MSIFSLPNNALTNENLNALASQFAQDTGADETNLIQRITNKVIFDAAPQQFFDLKLLNMQEFLPSASDEFFYDEMGYQRTPFTATAAAGIATDPATQTFAINDLDDISVDTIIIYPNNQKGIVRTINTSTSEITVAPYTGDSVPAVVIGDEFAKLSPVEGDGIEGFSQYFRANIVERFNFVQILSKAMRFGRAELHKHQNAGTFDNYLSDNKRAMMRQFRIDLSNVLWNGERGEVTVAGGQKAKTAGGVFPLMVQAGSPNASATLASLTNAFEDITLQTEFNEHGATRFAFATNRIILELSKAYKDDKTRYRPDDEIAKLGLNMVDIGSSKIVLVPFDRFKDTASFPAAFQNRIMIMDMETIRVKQMWGETSGETLAREDGIAKTFKDTWVETTFSIEFNNPLASGYVDVTL